MWITSPFQTISDILLMRRTRKFGEYTRIHWARMRERDGTFCPIIVWDFEAAPESKGSRDGMRELRDCVRFARDHGFLNILYAANSRNDAMISEWADEVRLTKYLTEIVVRKKKRLKDVYGIVKKYNANLAASFIVSSRLAPDIGFG
ncbi:MAG: hypothetical protein HY564_00345, partial [Candidatus Jacksonbacteria bacterium]|nr:hypothetical protein [Candidatus Jacksonbacteria bacterium]